MSNPYYPAGCTDADIDRAMGEEVPDSVLEEIRELEADIAYYEGEMARIDALDNEGKDISPEDSGLYGEANKFIKDNAPHLRNLKAEWNMA